MKNNIKWLMLIMGSVLIGSSISDFNSGNFRMGGIGRSLALFFVMIFLIMEIHWKKE